MTPLQQAITYGVAVAAFLVATLKLILRRPPATRMPPLEGALALVAFGLAAVTLVVFVAAVKAA